MPVLRLPRVRNFYPRSPCGERPLNLLNPRPARLFLSTLSLRRATDDQTTTNNGTTFLSTLSLRRATYGRINDISRLIFLSTLSLRRATQCPPYHRYRFQISIHALLAESDRQTSLLLRGSAISIHALLAESDGTLLGVVLIQQVFLSTLSLRRATINSRANHIKRNISIHALLAESD